jgi:hypothetical protein
MNAHKPMRIAGRIRGALGRDFAWCLALVKDTSDFASCLARTFNTPIESVFIGIGRQAIRAERLEAAAPSEEATA